MPYLNTDEYEKFLKYEKQKKAQYKRVNKYNREHYMRLSTSVTMADGKEFQRICKEMGISVNNMIKGLLMDFIQKYYESQKNGLE